MDRRGGQLRGRHFTVEGQRIASPGAAGRSAHLDRRRRAPHRGAPGGPPGGHLDRAAARLAGPAEGRTRLLPRRAGAPWAAAGPPTWWCGASWSSTTTRSGAREVGVAARGALTRKYAEFNPPDTTAATGTCAARRPRRRSRTSPTYSRTGHLYRRAQATPAAGNHSRHPADAVVRPVPGAHAPDLCSCSGTGSGPPSPPSQPPDQTPGPARTAPDPHDDHPAPGRAVSRPRPRPRGHAREGGGRRAARHHRTDARSGPRARTHRRRRRSRRPRRCERWPKHTWARTGSRCAGTSPSILAPPPRWSGSTAAAGSPETSTTPTRSAGSSPRRQAARWSASATAWRPTTGSPPPCRTASPQPGTWRPEPWHRAGG